MVIKLFPDSAYCLWAPGTVYLFSEIHTQLSILSPECVPNYSLGRFRGRGAFAGMLIKEITESPGNPKEEPKTTL